MGDKMTQNDKDYFYGGLVTGLEAMLESDYIKTSHRAIVEKFIMEKTKMIKNPLLLKDMEKARFTQF